MIVLIIFSELYAIKQTSSSLLVVNYFHYQRQQMPFTIYTIGNSMFSRL